MSGTTIKTPLKGIIEATKSTDRLFYLSRLQGRPSSSIEHFDIWLLDSNNEGQGIKN